MFALLENTHSELLLLVLIGGAVESSGFLPCLCEMFHQSGPLWQI